jgi:predicted anti-sigma-YlaC factor YlaD
MLSCREVTEHASEYLEGEQSFGRRMLFWMHLAMCSNCRRFLRQIKLVRDGLGAVPLATPTLSDETRAQLLAAFEEQARSE